VAVVALMVVATAVGIAMPVRRNLDDTRARRADERAVASATRGERAMVILPRVPDGGWIMHPRPNLRNDPRLQQRVLYAIDNGPDNLQLAASYPDRPLYRFTPRMVPDPNVIFGLMPATEVTRLAVVRGVEVRVPWRIRNHGDGAVVTVYLNDSHRVTVAVIDDQSTKGREYHGAWIIRGDGTITLDPPALHVLTQNFAPPLGRGTLRVGASVGDLPDPTSTAVWEVRYWFDGDGREAAFLAPGEQWLRRATAGTPFLPADTAPVFCVGPPSVSTASQSGELPAGC
jgi:hypothetical protein